MIKFVLPKKFQIYPSGQISIKVANKSIRLKTNQTSYLTRELFWKGPLEFEYTDIYITLIKKLNFIIDVGANIGYYSLIGAKLNPNLKVIAFEPTEGPLVYFLENLKINDLEGQVDVEPYALSDVSADIEFFVIKNRKYPTIYNLSGEHNTGKKRSTLLSSKIKVKSNTLNNYLKIKDIERIDLIKLDTEGSEHLILKGGRESIEKYRPIIVCETLYNLIEKDIMTFFSDLNYQYFNHTKNGLLKVKTVVRSSDDGIRNCFIVPIEKTYLIEEFIVS